MHMNMQSYVCKMKFKVGDILKYKSNHPRGLLYEVVKFNDQNTPFYDLKNLESGSLVPDLVASAIDNMFMLHKEYIFDQELKTLLE